MFPSRQDGPSDETERSVLSGSKAEDRRTDPVGPVGLYVTFDQVKPVAEGPVGPYVTLSPVGSDGKHSPCDTDDGSGSETEDRGTDHVGRVGPYATFDQVQPVAEGPVGPYITLSLVGSNGKYSLCDTDQPVADGPVGPSVTLGPVGPGGTSSQCKPYQLVADGPVGSTEELGLVGTHGKLLRIDIKTVVKTDEPAKSIGTSPSSDSGIHSLGEQWEDTSLIKTDTEEEQYRTSQIHTPTANTYSDSDTCVPPNTEEDQVTLCPWIDCLLNRKSDESPEIDMLDSDSDSEWNESEKFYSDQELTTDELSYADYETWTYAKNTTGMRDPVDPPVTSKPHKVSSAEQYEDKSSVYGETDGGNSDICNLADFSSEDEDIPVERNSGSQSVNMIGVDLIDGMTPMEYVPIPREEAQRRFDI